MLLLKVFVYGTLKRGQPNHKWLTDTSNGLATFISTGTTTQKLPLIIGTRYNIPFLLNKPGTGNYIRGEVYEIDETMLTRLDVLEDYPHLYNREIQNIQTESGLLQCWLYLLKSYPDTMLAKMMLSEYQDTVELPYQERSKRLTNLPAKNDLDYVIN